MKCFFTSSPILDDTVNPANDFVTELNKALQPNSSALFIASDPAGSNSTDYYGAALKACFEKAGFSFRTFSTLDDRNRLDAEQLIQASDFIILAGGHVPTQNRFFREIHLNVLLQAFRGTLMGISAGSMNSAEMVYAHPEREGEAADNQFERFRPGLGLTACMVLPHYQMIKDDVLDGLRIFEDIAYPDSVGRKFYALVDGSYILSCDGRERLFGEAYLIENGQLQKISSEGDVLPL